MAQSNKNTKSKQSKQQNRKNTQAHIQQEKKMAAAKKKGGSCCKWVLGSMAMIVLIGGVVVYDINVNGHGIFARSTLGKFCSRVGILPQVEQTWYTTMSASARGYKWAEHHVPPHVKPAIQLCCDLYKIVRNAAYTIYQHLTEYIAAKMPTVSRFLEGAIPGLPQKIENSYVTVKTVVIDAVESSIVYLKTRVFVDQLSPENMSKIVNETLATASNYYELFHEKVDAYAKLK